MERRYAPEWLKHGDFIFLDIFCLQLCFLLAFWLRQKPGTPYGNQSMCYQLVILQMSQLLLLIFTDNYQEILRRRPGRELLRVLKNTAEILIAALVYLFVFQQTAVASRSQFGYTLTLYAAFDLAVRELNKVRIRRRGRMDEKKSSVVLVTVTTLMDEAMERLARRGDPSGYFISEIILMDEGPAVSSAFYGVPVTRLNEGTITEITHGWVDEVFILVPESFPFPVSLANDLMNMGITVSFAIPIMNNGKWTIMDVKQLGGYHVMTGGIRFGTAGQLLIKRLMDILGGLVGCAATGIVFLFIAPAIYIKSPGPIFFSQKRVGQNGRTFRIYKFRSMYLDAEERKAALLQENDIKGNAVFKINNDPRIIGSEKKDKQGRPRGIGNFIRSTSLDEFPQFFNVLKGEMSLVGTRPPTIDDWERYDLSHRVRMCIRPGLTGMWQVSGRSSITSMDQVVELDRSYIENWNLGLDVKILLRTVKVVLFRNGAM